MLESQPLIVYVVGAIIVGVAMDWAILERVKITIGAFNDHNEVKYRNLPKWRVQMVVIAAAIVGVSLSTPALDVALFCVSTAMFIALNIHGNYLALRRRSK